MNIRPSRWLGLLLAGTALPVPLQAQTDSSSRVSLTGRVIDGDSKHPVTHARVELRQLGLQSLVDSTGRFTLRLPISRGCVRLQIRAIGYGWTDRTVRLTETGERALGDIPLRPAPIPEWPLLLMMQCLPAEPSDAPWGIDTSFVPAGNPGTNLSVRVDVVALTRSGDTSQVSYIARNGPGSREPLWALTIDAPAAPLWISTPTPADSWAVFNSYGDTPVVHWASLTGSMASPGASTPTLSFKAIGLPAIVAAHAEGYYEPPEVDIVEEEDILSPDPIGWHSVATKVVGVEPPPPRATTGSLTRRLEILTRQSCSLGWIAQPILCTKLRGHLTAPSARLAFFRNDLVAGHTRGGPVNDNAYWLLKVNVEYILGRRH